VCVCVCTEEMIKEGYADTEVHLPR
jgi:hypothetical protein